MTSLYEIKTLEELWIYTKTLHKNLFPTSNLAPIMAGGKISKPKFMFIFINPTYKNISSDLTWEGKRRPWIGTKYIWKIFSNAGHFDKELLLKITNRKKWDIAFADEVYDHLAQRNFYFTNIVKWTGENGDLPDTNKINAFLPILLREIQLVEPEYIVTFGLIPFKALVNEPIKLKEYYDVCMTNNMLKVFPLSIGDRKFNVIPCYFPVGRGDPKRATKILNLLP